MGVLVFGTGRLYSKFRWLLVQADVLAFLDNDVEKQGKIIDGCAVLSPEQVQEFKIKVSGYFRSLEGAKEFAKINSVLSTARKHGIAVIDTIMATLAQASCIPWALASE